MKEKAIIFDLDGTLINSLTDIALCANKVLEKFNMPTHEIEDYKNFVGGGALFLMENCSAKNSTKDEVYELFESFKAIYDTAIYENTKPYDGIYELLDKLLEKNYKIGVLSNKPHEFTLKYVDKFFAKYKFQEVHGQKENIPKKPDPIAAINIAKAFDVDCENIIFVGDTGVDMKTAKSAKMKAIGVAWGFRGTKELLKNGADHIVQTPQDILQLLE